MTSVLPWSAGVLPSPNWLRMRLSPRSFSQAERALHVVGEHAARLERHDHVLPVDDGRGRGPGAVLVVRGLVRLFFPRGAFPDDLAGPPVDGQEHELVRHRLRAPRGVLRVARHAHRHGARHEHAVAPHDGRGRPAAGDLHLPADVLRFTPLDGRRRRGGHAGPLRPAPLRPEPIARRLLRRDALSPAGPRRSPSHTRFAKTLVPSSSTLPLPIRNHEAHEGHEVTRRRALHAFTFFMVCLVGSLTAAATSSAWPSTLTLSHRLATLPSGPTR